MTPATSSPRKRTSSRARSGEETCPWGCSTAWGPGCAGSPRWDRCASRWGSRSPADHRSTIPISSNSPSETSSKVFFAAGFLTLEMMMRRLLLALPLLLAVPVRAQAMKIGYVDVQRAIQEVEEGKAARARLQDELKQKRGDLERKRAELEKLKADYDKQAPVLSEDAKRKKQEELQKAFVDAQQGA